MSEPYIDKHFSFARTLSGHYSNKRQSSDNPKDYAHINIYFLPLSPQVLGAPGFYSEQSYDYDPWRPYRQGIHKLLPSTDGPFIVENYSLADPLRVAGAGKMPELLKAINPSLLQERCGCAMHFYEIEPGKYQGQVEPGKNCIVPRSGQLTYLVSEVLVDESTWTSRDRGYDPITHAQVWGSEHGKLRFKRVKWLNETIENEWLSKLHNG